VIEAGGETVILLTRVGVGALVLLGFALNSSGNGGERISDASQDPIAILNQALTAADEAPDREVLLGDISIAFARANRADAALRVLGEITSAKDRVRALLGIAASHASLRDFPQAVHTANMLPDSPRWQTIALIADQQARAVDVGAAIRTIDTELGKGPNRNYALLLLGQLQEAEGNFLGASRIYELVATPSAKARALRASAKAWIRAGEFDAASRAAAETSRVLRSIPPPAVHHSGVQGVDPDMTRNGLLQEMAEQIAKSGDWKRAAETAETISSSYLRPIAMAKIAAIRAQAGERDMANVMLKRAAAAAAEGPSQGYQLTEIAAAQTAAGEIDTARKTFLRAVRKVWAHNASSQAYVVDVQSRAGDHEGAIQTIRAISEEAIRDRALQSVARHLAEASDARQALEVGGMIISARIRLSALLEISQAQAKAGDRTGALSTLRKVEATEGAGEPDIVRTISRDRAEFGSVSDALAWANSRESPISKAWALLGVAEGMLPPLSLPELQLQSLP
jgi:tetratricopeptide (TPR) repeat protein